MNGMFFNSAGICSCRFCLGLQPPLCLISIFHWLYECLPLWLHCQCISEPLASFPHHGCYSCWVRPCFGSPCSGVCLLGQMYCFGDANFRGINVIAILEEVFKGCFLSLLLCWWGFYAELHVVDEPTFCHNQLLWLFLRLHLVLPLEREVLL